MLRTFVRDYDHEAVVVTVNGEAIETTQLHPFWVIDGDDLTSRPVREHLVAPPENSQLQGRWVDAVDLQAGDTVFLQGPGPTPIESVLLKPAHYPVYNFAVHELKCYAVGKSSVLVHNSNGIELPTNLGPLGKKAPSQVTPGTRVLEGHYIDDLGRSQPWLAHYDEFGRQIARTDFNAGNASQRIADVHHHIYEYTSQFPLGHEIASHVPGAF